MNQKQEKGPTVKRLNQLHPEMENILIIAMVLNKTEPCIFLSKNDSQYRAVMNFTLRDSTKDIVNCTFWCSREKVEEFNDLIQIGDIVDVANPKITLVKLNNDSKQAQYQPVTSLPISLVCNEGEGYIVKHNHHLDMERYREIKLLEHQSHKPLHSVMNLADVRYSDTSGGGFHTDFLIVVGLVKTPRDIRPTKDGRARRCCEILVFDQSLTSGMTLTIWHSDWIRRAQDTWQPMKTVLHLIDVKISYSDFYKSCILSTTSRSIIYENPIGSETQNLQKFAESTPKAPFDMLTHTTSDNLPKPEDINTIMTVRQIYSRAEGQMRDNSEQFTAVLYTMITKFDVEWKNSVVNKRCKACKRLISYSKTICDTEQCQLSFSFDYTDEKYEYFFNLNVHCTDHTGTLIETRLSDAIAVRILGITCEEYLNMNDSEIEQLKGRFLLNHFEVKLLVKKTNTLRRKVVVLIIDMRPVDLDELAKKIAVF
ncbi:meiosis specific with OB domains hold'em [Haematobia irritans]|uniref:meiosis specific with OB domains hold'em n=1 Tax=Haematobia irritans TaxID=7368 RepID=UPI003F501637